MLVPSVTNVVAKYKEKKEVPKADGSGTTTVYVYGPRQIAERNRAKAERVENLRNNIERLRKKYEADLDAEDASTRLTALAVALIDHTYERVGNDSSAENGHFGVTGWQADHITFAKGKATLKYVGKSGVDHEKVVDDPVLVKALKKAVEGKKGKDKILCEGEDCSITSAEVNAYLKDFGITAKDIRGLHANEEVKAALKKVRSKGPDLPKDRKERDKILKGELKEALEIAAEAVGHEPSTLKNQYLVPGLVDSFLHDGTILDKLHEKKGSGPTTIDRSDPGLLGWVREFFGRYPALKKYLTTQVARVENPHRSRHPEASYARGNIEIYPKFWALPPAVRDVVFAHEIGHHVLEKWGDRNMLQVAEQLGIDPWDSANLPYGEFNYDEAFATCFAEYHVDNSEMSRRYPLWASLVARIGKREAYLNPPQDVWVEVSPRSLDEDDQETIWHIYEFSYGTIGMHIGSPQQLLGKYQDLELLNVDFDPEVEAFVAIKRTPFGNKVGLLGTDGHPRAKAAVKQYLVSVLRTDGWYCEASHRIKKLLDAAGVEKIEDESVVKEVLGGKDIVWLGDGDYQRSLGEVGTVRKSLYGRPRVSTSRVAAGNQKIIEAPHNFHLVVVEPPKAKRKEFPFEGYIDFQGIEIDVENVKGSTRSGTDPSGEKWSIEMHAHYGEIRGTEGTDGDKLDVYVGDNHDSSVVVVIYQHDPDTGAYDEDKVMLGFDSIEEAIGLYKKQYDRPGFFKKDQFLAMPIGQFWRWVSDKKNQGKKVRAASMRRIGIINLWNATDGEGDLRGIPGLISSLTGYEQAIVQELLIHGQPILEMGLGYTLRGHEVDPGAVNELLASGYLQETSDGIRLSTLFEAKARLYTTSVRRVAARFATKSRVEKEDEATEALVKPSPKKKPPREDLRERRIDRNEDEDPDEKADRKDSSNNYKDASLRAMSIRVAARFARTDIPSWAEGKKFTHDESGNSVAFGSLPPEQQQRLREQHDADVGLDDEDEVDEDPAPPDSEGQDTPAGNGSEDPEPGDEEPDDADAEDEDQPVGAPGGGGPSPMPEPPDDIGTETGLRNYRMKVVETYKQLGLAANEAQDIANKITGADDVESAAQLLDEAVSTKTAEKAQKQRERASKKVTKHLGPEAAGLQTKLDGMTPEGFGFFNESFKSVARDLVGTPPSRKEMVAKVKEATKQLKTSTDPDELGRAAAVVTHWESITNNPAVDLDHPVPAAGTLLADADLAKASDKSVERASRAVEAYRDLSPDDRKNHAAKLAKELEDLPENDARAVELRAIQKGISFASAIMDGNEATGVASSMARLIKAADRSGNLRELMAVSAFGSPEESDQAVIRSVYEDLTSSDWADLVGEDHPAHDLAVMLSDSGKNKYMSPEDKERIREALIDMMLADTAFLDPAVSDDVGADATVGKHDQAARAARQKAAPKRSRPRSGSPASDILSWLKEFTRNLVTRNPWSDWYHRPQ